jgi:predicted acylesterase/phospholipase RssA
MHYRKKRTRARRGGRKILHILMEVKLNESTSPPPPPPPRPNTLIISGGGIAGFSIFGALKETNLRGVWRLSEIKKIYAVSAGAGLAVCIALGFEWNVLNEYFIRRRWGAAFKWTTNLLRFFYDMGIYDKTIIADFFRPLFAAKDIDPEITLRELYLITGVEIHIYCVELFGFHYIDMSYLTHPNMKVLDAVYRSCTIPFFFKPDTEIDEDGKKYVFIDGCFLGNYPSHIDGAVENPDTTIGFRFNILNPPNVNNIMEFLQKIAISVLQYLNRKCVDLPRQIKITYDNNSFRQLYNTIYDAAYREQLVKIGENYGRDFAAAAGGVVDEEMAAAAATAAAAAELFC